MVPLKINNIPCNLELDTGASVTVIPEDMWKNELGSVPLQKSSVTLKSYSGHATPVVGEATVHVQYHAQEVNLQREWSCPHGERFVVENQVGLVTFEKPTHLNLN